MKFGKVWGETQLVFKNDNFEVHRLKAKAGRRCSKHYHQFKHNLFFVESGHLKIYVFKNDYELVDETVLFPGERISVKPMEKHYFEAITDVVAYEIYFTEPISDDIIREGVGG